MSTDFDLTGKVAIVTGGNGGIGYGIAHGLAKAGANIVVAARDPAKNAQAIATLQELGIQALSVFTDVQDETSVQAMVQATVEAFGRVDILVNNAGINIGSMTSVFGSSVSPAYAATKGGVVQFTKSLAVFWAKDNIQVNAILPGWIHTGLTASASPERYNSITVRIPHGRWGEPDELAGAAVFLASRASDYVTGIALPVDGGYTSK